MLGRPEAGEAAPYYSTYTDLVSSDDIVRYLETQLDEVSSLLSGISEEKSLHRYASDKWSIRELLNHVNDAERVFAFRAMWFARGFSEPLPSYDQNVGVQGARADDISWAEHIEDFRNVRQASLTLFKNLPEEAWLRSGIASDNPFTVRALAYIVAGHVAHHANILQQRYL